MLFVSVRYQHILKSHTPIDAYHLISSHLLSYHFIYYHIISYQISYHMSYPIMTYHIISCHTMSYCCLCLYMSIHVWICIRHTCIIHILMFGWIKNHARKPALTVLKLSSEWQHVTAAIWPWTEIMLTRQLMKLVLVSPRTMLGNNITVLNACSAQARKHYKHSDLGPGCWWARFLAWIYSCCPAAIILGSW